MKAFEFSPRLAKLIAGDQQRLGRFPEARNYFFDGATPLPEDHLLKNPDYAMTLTLIAKQGAKGFYQGETAEAMISAVTLFNDNPGRFNQADLMAYKAKQRRPVSSVFKMRYGTT